jgi:Ca2+-binding RTX toxin-like protein
VLGLADGVVITIDDDGAGAGWSRSLTDVAGQQYDLLTVVGHEIGHALGFADSDPVNDLQDLMNGELTVGVRHNSLGNIDDFFGAAIFDVTGIGAGPVDPVSASNAITVSIDGSGTLIIADTSDNGLNQTLTLSTADGVLTISDPGNSLIANAGTLVAIHRIQVAISQITSGNIVIDLQNGADILDGSAVEAGLSLNVTGGAGNDMITGGQGDDTIDGGAGNDELAGGGGTDTLIVNGNANVTITGLLTVGDGTDAHGGFERAVISGGSSNDRLDASQANMPVTLFGNDGDDTLLGSSENDIVDGGAGDDVAEFAGSNITLTATSVTGAGDDLLISMEGLQLRAVASGSTIDASAYSGGSVTIVGSSGDDTLTGGAGDDLIIAGSGRDVVAGGPGDDVILGGSGDDTLSGGAGKDTISGGQGRDSINGGSDDDDLRGGPHADTLKGGGGNDQLRGDAGDDVLEGETGDDALVGGAGANSLIGGEGNDTLNNIAVADDFNAPVGIDHLIGGNAPQARPAPVSPTPLTASVNAPPPSANAVGAATDDNAESVNDRDDVDSATLDAAFGDALILDLLDL